MRRNHLLVLVVFCAALLVGGGLVLLVGKKGEGADQVVSEPKKMVAVAELVADTLGVRPVETEATGRAEFTLIEDGKALAYKITVNSLEDVFMSHLHLAGPEDRYGSLLVWLWPTENRRREVKEGRFDGVLVEGVIRAENLAGALCQRTLPDLLDAIRAGKVFADIHTRRNVPGELRGQLKIISQ